MNKKRNKRVALVLGATGLVGGHCVRLLLASERYSKVIVVGRSKLMLAHSRLQHIVGDLSDLNSLISDCIADDIFCCLGTTIKKAKSKSEFKKIDYEYPMNLARIMRDRGSEHFCVVSAVGASANSHFFYNRIKGELERDLVLLGYPYLSVLRPSLLVGDRGEYRLAESISAAIGGMLKPFLVGALLEVSPVEAKQVAGVMVEESIRIMDGQRYQNKVLIKSRQIHEYK